VVAVVGCLPKDHTLPGHWVESDLFSGAALWSGDDDDWVGHVLLVLFFDSLQVRGCYAAPL